MNIEQIKEIIEKAEYEVYGVRGDDGIVYSVGDICERSRQWWQDDPGEEAGLEYNEDMQCWDGGELSGTCAFAVDAENVDEMVECARRMFGGRVVLIAGNVYEGGNDIGEVIIEDARVLAVIE